MALGLFRLFPASCPFRLSLALLHPLPPQTVREVCFPSVKLRPLIRLSCSLRNKAYTPIGLELRSRRDTSSSQPRIDPISRISPPYSTASNQIDLRFAVYLSPQFLQIYGSFYHSPLPLLHRKIRDTAEPFRSGKVMLSLPSSLLRTHPPPSCLSAHFVYRLIVPTSAPHVSIRDKEGFPS